MEILFLKSATRKEQYPDSSLPKVAFAGRSNVGKSSLINSLLGRKKMARTSATPGRTQVINFFSIDARWIFADLPGYGFARAPSQVRARWGPMVEEFLREDERLRLTILLVDARHAPTELDLVMKDYLDETKVTYQVVATKVDKLRPGQRAKSLQKINETMHLSRVVPYSSATGMGKKDLWQIIREV